MTELKIILDNEIIQQIEENKEYRNNEKYNIDYFSIRSDLITDFNFIRKVLKFGAHYFLFHCFLKAQMLNGGRYYIFEGDIDPVTARVIDKGRKNERLLIQPQYKPVAVEEEVAIIYAGTKGLLENVPLDKVAEFEQMFLQLLHAKHQSDVLDVIKKGQLTDDVMEKLNAAANDIAGRYKQ